MTEAEQQTAFALRGLVARAIARQFTGHDPDIFVTPDKPEMAAIRGGFKCASSHSAPLYGFFIGAAVAAIDEVFYVIEKCVEGTHDAYLQNLIERLRKESRGDI
jgi:hypothetical protein